MTAHTFVANGWIRLWVITSILAFVIVFGTALSERHYYGSMDFEGKAEPSATAVKAWFEDAGRVCISAEKRDLEQPSEYHDKWTFTLNCETSPPYLRAFGFAAIIPIALLIAGASLGWIYRGFRPMRTIV